MNTTALFVELVVIGAGATVWLLFLVLSIFGYSWVPWKEANSFVALIPFLSFTYVTGILVDRVSDQIFSKWDKRIRKEKFLSNEEYHKARTYTYSFAEDRIINLFEYGRSRLRISRAWSINFLLLAITSSMFIFIRLPNELPREFFYIMIFSFLFCSSGSLLSFFSWKNLAKNDYNRLAETYILLKEGKGYTLNSSISED